MQELSSNPGLDSMQLDTFKAASRPEEPRNSPALQPSAAHDVNTGGRAGPSRPPMNMTAFEAADPVPPPPSLRQQQPGQLSQSGPPSAMEINSDLMRGFSTYQEDGQDEDLNMLLDELSSPRG